MGLFLQVAIMPGGKKADAKAAVEAVAEKYSCTFDALEKGDCIDEDMIISELVPEECQYMENENGVGIFLNDGCIGYDSLAKAISKESGKACLLLYIYDGDYWGYWLYDNGEYKDQFMPMPDYFEEPSEETIRESMGDADIIAKYFHVEKAAIERYLVRWTGELRHQKAYEEDEYGYGDDWQITDFMGRLGYPWPDHGELIL